MYDMSGPHLPTCNHYSITVRDKFDTLEETSERLTPNDEYENFVTAHLEAATKCIPIKPRAKSRVPKESKAVQKKMR